MSNLVNDTRIRTTSQRSAIVRLLCPRCGSDNFRHEAVTMFDRENGSSVSMDVGDGKQRGRRDPGAWYGGLEVHFYCVPCGATDEKMALELVIARTVDLQSTEIGWRYMPEAKARSRRGEQ